MKAFDNTIKYFELLMTYDDTSRYTRYDLPSGFHFEFYNNGDMEDWINIHLSSHEFTSVEEGIEIFHSFYDSFIDELDKRCIFIVDDKTSEKVGTVTVSLLNNKEYGYDAAIDWLAIKSDFQGKHLSKPLISKMIEVANNLGHKRIILHTQTTTPLAARLYLDYGFEILNNNEKMGWNILKTIIDHPKLKNFDTLDIDDIYDKRNIEIENQLRKIFKSEDFNYMVWYKNGMHNVYVYYNEKTYEFEYFEDDNGLILEEVKDKKYKR